MTLSVDGTDAGSDPDVSPIVLEAPMTYNASQDRYEFVFENVGVNLDERRFVISTNEGGSYNERID